jgi:hypothetical protein
MLGTTPSPKCRKWSRNGEPPGDIQICSEENQVVLAYRHRKAGEEWEPKEYAVPLEWTHCNYGGQRAWFRCPARGCGRRAAILYGGEIFACRHCYQLAYPCQRESSGDRALAPGRSGSGAEGGVIYSTLF